MSDGPAANLGSDPPARVLQGIGAALVAVALTAAAGWWFDLPRLTTWTVGGGTMKPDMVAGVLALGTSLILRASGRRVAADASGVLVVAVGGAAIAHHLVDPDALHGALTTARWPNTRISTATASSLVAVGLGWLAAPRIPAAAQALGVYVAGVAGITFAAYSYGLTNLEPIAFLRSISLPAAVSLALGAAAVFLQSADGPITRVFRGDGASNRLARRVGVLVLAVPWVVGLVVIHGSHGSGVDASFTAAIVAIGSAGFTFSGVWWVVRDATLRDEDLRATLDSIGDAVLITDREGLVTRLNPVAEAMTGWSLADAVGRRVEEIYRVESEATRAPAANPVTEVLATGRVVGLANHTVLVARDGTERPIADSGAPIRAADGRVRGVVLVFRDQTAEAATRRELERVAQNLRALMDASPSALIAAREGVAVYANPAALRMFGVPAEQFVGRSLLDFVRPEERAVVQRRQQAWIHGAVPPPRRTLLVTPAGDVLVDSIPLPGQVDFDGVGVQVAALERVGDRDGLAARLARKAVFVEATSELARSLAFAAFDLDGVLRASVRAVVAGPHDVAVAKLVGGDATTLGDETAVYAQDDALAAIARRFDGPMGARMTQAVLDRGDVLVVDGAAFRAGTSPEVRAALGDANLCHVAVAPLRAAGRVLGVLVLARYVESPFDEDTVRFLEEVGDRTGQAVLNARLHATTTAAVEQSARAAAVLRETEAQLRHSQKLDALGQLAGGVAHDFNNLLTVILSLTEMLVDRRPPGDRDRADLSEIQRAGERAAALTGQLLAFGRKQPMQLGAVDVNEVVRELERMLVRLLGEGVALRLTLAPSVPGVRADASLLSQVIVNLAVNARDASPPGGDIEIRTSVVADTPPGLPEGRYVQVHVVDRGAGLSDDVRDHLFEPFFTTKPRGRGTGLGLSTSYGIARQSGGALTAEGAPGAGATFTLWLPAVAESAPRAAAAAASVVARETGGVVMLVEDEVAVREAARRILTNAGYQVYPFACAEDALVAEPSLGHLDLLVTDVVMPGRSGRELADEVAVRRPGLPVLFVSGYVDDAVLRVGVQEGLVTLLQKPFSPTTLLDAVTRARAR